MAKDVKKKKPASGMTTRERMMERKRQMAERSSGGSIIFPKEGTMRVRLVSQGPDKELGLEIIQFYSQKTGGIISPATFDEPCPFMEKFQELRKSSDEEDQELAKKLTPRRRFLVAGTLYKDEKGKEIDTDNVCKPILIPRSVYQDIIDLYLDEDDWGDMTDPEDGYDIKITRSGKGKMDTSYSVSPCPKGKNPNPKYIKEVDLEEVIKASLPSYDELEGKLNEFLNGADLESDDYSPKKKWRDDEDEDAPKKKKASKDKKKKKGLDL